MRANQDHLLLPGKHNRHRNKSFGKSLPNATIDGAVVYFSSDELTRFANILTTVSGAQLSAWEFSFEVAEF